MMNATPGSFNRPILFSKEQLCASSPFPMPPGLILMHGPKASGKTVTSLALAHQLKADGVPVSYNYMMEPRAQGSAAAFLKTTEDWEAWLKNALQACSGGVLIIDSLTYLLHHLSVLRTLEESISRVTYAGGLTPKDNISVLLYDEMARVANTCLVATINSELLPVVEKLEGACEGQIELHSPGTFSVRTRFTRRPDQVALSEWAMIQAQADLGYPLTRIDYTQNQRA